MILRNKGLFSFFFFIFIFILFSPGAAAEKKGKTEYLSYSQQKVQHFYRPQQPKKIAFLFLIRYNLPFLEIWQEFFTFHGRKEYYNIYVHSSTPYVFEKGSVFYNRTISEHIETSWGKFSLIQATRALLKAALSGDFDNYYFALFSESCIPLYAFTKFYRILTSDTRSIVFTHKAATREDHYRWHREFDAKTKLVKTEYFRKTSQWFMLNRKHALIISAYTVDDDIWEKVFAADEHFIPSALAALHYISDYMKETFETVSKFMHILFVIIRSQDYDLYNHLVEAKMEPFFAISWLITWFSHDIKELNNVARLYDALLSSPPIYCFYLSAAYILSLREQILATEPDFAIMHNLLIKAPSKFDFPVEETIRRADDLYNKLPFSKVLPLCDRALFKIITCNNITLFEKPSFQISAIDSDWKLLENMKVSRWQNLQYWKYYFQYSLGWNIPALLSSTSLAASALSFDSIMSLYSYDENLLDGIEEDHPKSRFYLFFLRKLLAKRSKEDQHQQHKKLQQSQEQQHESSSSQKGNQRKPGRWLPFLSFNQILWSITIVIGGVLGYLLVFGNPPLIPPGPMSSPPSSVANPLSE